MIQFEEQHNNSKTFVIYDTILKISYSKFFKGKILMQNTGICQYDQVNMSNTEIHVPS